jgi:hypothetical protein
MRTRNFIPAIIIASICLSAHGQEKQTANKLKLSAAVKDKTVKNEGCRMYFQGLTWELAGPSGLNVYLAIENQKDGSVREEIFKYKKVK